MPVSNDKRVISHRSGGLSRGSRLWEGSHAGSRVSDIFFQIVAVVAGVLLTRAVVRSSTSSLDGSGRLRVGLGRRGRHTPVVTGQSLAIPNCEMKAAGFLKSFVSLVGSLGNGTSAGLAQWVPARCAKGAAARDGGLTVVASPHAEVRCAVCSVQLGDGRARIVLGAGEGRSASLVRASGVLRKLSGRTVDAILCKKLAGVVQGDSRHSGL